MMDLVNRLRDELEETRMGHRVVVAAMSEERDLLERAITQLNNSVHRVTAERDKARIQVCILCAVTTKLKQAPKTTLAEAMQIAKKFGWDCFLNVEDT